MSLLAVGIKDNCFLYRVCHLAGEFIKNLQQKNMRFIPGTEISEADKLNITHEEEMCVRLAGLCHDLGMNNELLFWMCSI